MNTGTFYANLATAINTTPEKAQTLVKDFNTGTLEFFSSYFDSLPTATLVTNNTKNNSVNVTLFVEEDPIGSGAFATIQKNRSQPFVYKLLQNRYYKENRLQYIKPLFKEIVIQTLLQSDTKYGKHICKLYKVYKVGSDAVFQIEPLETTIETYFEAQKPESKATTITKTFVKLLEIISHFKNTYGFSHNDLKLDNVMTVKAGADLKLIDFGLSSIKFGTIELGKPSKAKADMQYLFYSLSKYLEVEPNAFSELVETLVQLPIETPIQTYVDKLQPPKAQSGSSRRKTKKARSTRFRVKY